ncbi:unnamed protein product [Rhizophagus irregularis]|nr:unnamed protein product [Rhizophagus irregularis]
MLLALVLSAIWDDGSATSAATVGSADLGTSYRTGGISIGFDGSFSSDFSSKLTGLGVFNDTEDLSGFTSTPPADALFIVSS